jgi:hypothetical protein
MSSSEATLELDTFMLADAVSAHEGKVYLHGAGLTRINAVGLPVALPQLSVFARFRPDEEDLSRGHSLYLALLDPQGDPVVAPQELEIGPLPRPTLAEGEEFFAQLVFTFAPVVFAIAGVYRFEFLVDGESVRSMTFPVIDLTPT